MNPDWKRHERQSSVKELQSQLIAQQHEMKTMGMMHSADVSSEVMEDVKK